MAYWRMPSGCQSGDSAGAEKPWGWRRGLNPRHVLKLSAEPADHRLGYVPGYGDRDSCSSNAAALRKGGGKVPHDTVMNKWAFALGPKVITSIHERAVAIPRQNKVVAGHKMRVDTTVAETKIHYPIDSSSMGDGVHVLTDAMKRITAIAGDVGAKLRDRSRSVKHRIQDIGRAARSKTSTGKEKLQRGYRKLLASVSRLAGQAECFSREIASGCNKFFACCKSSIGGCIPGPLAGLYK